MGKDVKGRTTQTSRAVHGSKRAAPRVANEMDAAAGRAAPAGRTVADVLDACPVVSAGITPTRRRRARERYADSPWLAAATGQHGPPLGSRRWHPHASHSAPPIRRQANLPRSVSSPRRSSRTSPRSGPPSSELRWHSSADLASSWHRARSSGVPDGGEPRRATAPRQARVARPSAAPGPRPSAAIARGRPCENTKSVTPPRAVLSVQLSVVMLAVPSTRRSGEPRIDAQDRVVLRRIVELPLGAFGSQVDRRSTVVGDGELALERPVDAALHHHDLSAIR